ncbi:MAG: glycosyltransferase family 2 protein [Synechococcus sp.]
MIDTLESPNTISIIIPTFNGGDWLLEAIASCLKGQSLTPEVIVVDDGSSDDTPERVSATFPQIRLIRQASNSGSGSAGRNRGLELAQGRYVKFLDHDDRLEPGSLALELQAAEATGADMVMSRWGDVRLDEHGQPIEATRRVRIPPAPERLLDAMVLGEELPYTAGVLYRRSYIAQQRWDPRLTINDDFDWFCRQALRGGRIIRLEHVSYYWRLHDNSLQGSQRHNPRSFVEATYINDHVYRHMAASLQAEGRLNPFRSCQLARRLYPGLRCLARFNRPWCLRSLSWIQRLQPGFTPDAELEPSPAIRLAIRLLGLRGWLFLFALLRWPLDQLRPLPGRIRFFLADDSL